VLTVARARPLISLRGHRGARPGFHLDGPGEASIVAIYQWPPFSGKGKIFEGAYGREHSDEGDIVAAYEVPPDYKGPELAVGP
jgi:hypothetical protein